MGHGVKGSKLRSEIDRHKLSEDVYLALHELRCTVDPQWGDEWLCIATAIAHATLEIDTIRQYTLRPEIRHDPRTL